MHLEKLRGRLFQIGESIVSDAAGHIYMECIFVSVCSDIVGLYNVFF